MRFSASRLKTWMNCPAQAQFKYVDKLPDAHNAKTVFGTCVHRALELYNETGNAELAEAEFLTWWDEPEKAGYPDYGRWPKGNDYGKLRNKGVSIIRKQHELTAWDKREVLATEHGFVVPFGEHELHGYVDLLEIRRSGNGKEMLRVVDYKSGSWKPNRAALALDVQFTVYDYASRQREFWVGGMDPDFPGVVNGEWLWEMHKDTPRRNIWFHLSTPQEIDAGGRDEGDFQRLYRLCEQVQASSDAGIAIPKISEACVLCSYNEPCGVEIPTAEEMREEPNAWL